MLTDKRVTEAQMNEYGVCEAPDRLTGTAAENKAVFDRLMRQIVASCVNPVIDELASVLGAAAVGAAVGGMAGDNVQALLSALKTLVDDRYTKAEADALLGTNTNTLLANVALDGAGVWTFTRKDGTTVVYDTKLEKIAVNFTLDGDYLVLHHDDGAEDRVSIAAFRDHHQFTNSDTVSWSWTGEESNRTFTASVRANSITLDMLALDAVAKIEADVAASGQNAAAAQDAKTQAQTAAGQANAHKADAQAAQTAAQASAKTSESYAKGGTGTRTGEDADNAKYYSAQAQTARTAAEAAKTSAESAAQTAGGEADRAKSEADRAAEIVGGDYATQTEFTTHATDEAKHTTAAEKQAWNGKAAPARNITATLTVADWTGSGPYTQTINAAEVTADSAQVVEVGLADAATADQREAARTALLSPTGKAAGSITITADGEKPAIDLPVAVVIFG